jgi:hypothetical protein
MSCRTRELRGFASVDLLYNQQDRVNNFGAALLDGACTIWYVFYVRVSKNLVKILYCPARYENAMRGDLRTTSFVTARVYLLSVRLQRGTRGG